LNSSYQAVSIPVEERPRKLPEQAAIQHAMNRAKTYHAQQSKTNSNLYSGGRRSHRRKRVSRRKSHKRT